MIQTLSAVEIIILIILSKITLSSYQQLALVRNRSPGFNN